MAGVTNLPEPIRTACAAQGFSPIRSSATWGTKYTSPNQKEPSLTTKNDMDWDIARAAYFDALTKGTSAERDQHLAKTFQVLGQVVHLVQDVAVPAHVRDDFASHAEYFEPSFTSPIRWWANDFERYVRRNSGLLTGGQPLNPNSFMGQPVTRFWDTGQYRQSKTPSLDFAQGLAEYTNANFFSQNTPFTDALPATDPRHFPHPARANTTLPQLLNAGLLPRQVNAEDGIPDTVLYVEQVQGPGELSLLLAKAGFFHKPILAKGSAFQTLLPLGFQLDDQVMAAYATRLLPRAVAYSAGFLDYFFLASDFDFFIELDDQNPTQLKLLFQNVSSDDMVGAFTLYADNQDGIRSEVVNNGPDRTMTVGSNNPILFQSDALPDGVQRLIMVFQGMHGAEPNAVGGRVKSWEMPFILAKQESTAFSADAVEWEDRSYYPQSWARGLKKEPGKQLAKGTFVTPADTPAGKSVKRLWLDYGQYPSPGAELRLYDKDGTAIAWDPVSWNTNTLTDKEPSRWEIQVDLATAYASSTYYDNVAHEWRTISWVTLPRYLVIETLAGTVIRNPLVWWRSLGVTSGTGSKWEDTVNCGAPVEPDYFTRCGTLVSTSVAGELFFGDGDLLYGRDLTSTGTRYPVNGSQPTAVHFVPEDPVAGHAVGASDTGSISCGPPDACMVADGACTRDVAKIFQSTLGDGQLVWAKDTVYFYEGHRTYEVFHSVSGALPTPPMPALPPFPDVQLKRDYLPAEITLLTKIGIQQGLDYKVTLK